MAANVRMDDGGRIAEVGKESDAFFEGLLGMGLRRFAGLSRFLGRDGVVLPGRMALCGKEVLWGDSGRHFVGTNGMEGGGLEAGGAGVPCKLGKIPKRAGKNGRFLLFFFLDKGDGPC